MTFVGSAIFIFVKCISGVLLHEHHPSSLPENSSEGARQSVLPAHGFSRRRILAHWQQLALGSSERFAIAPPNFTPLGKIEGKAAPAAVAIKCCPAARSLICRLSCNTL
jgi:hypothetical protein